VEAPAELALRYGMDLFARGFFWEAHEAWEGLWRDLGREGKSALLVKGLIKLAAAGVKLRQGNERGVRAHLDGARTCFEKVPVLDGVLAGELPKLDLDDLARQTRDAPHGDELGVTLVLI
jgi:hypothetical protein